MQPGPLHVMFLVFTSICSVSSAVKSNLKNCPTGNIFSYWKLCFQPREGYSHNSGIYGWAEKKFPPMRGAFFSIPAPIMGTFLEILSSKNGHCPSKWPKYCPLWVGFHKLWWVLFCDSLRMVFASWAAHLWRIPERVPPPGFQLVEKLKLNYSGLHNKNNF